MDREKILIEEVKVVQDIIKRMASNSFSIKTWTITLIVATLLFKGNNHHIFIAFIPLFAFWVLDSYYLRQERLFRKVHNSVVKYRLNSDSDLFNMDTIKHSKDVEPILRIMFSISTLPFYGSIFIMLLSYMFIIYSKYFECIKEFISICIGVK